ncbi:hypothetical protein [Qipengyuania sp. 902]|uniref:hypothetical protein n=1 Tax=Qipengyuania sp. 902 TaxID=3417565 RepID=UPI003EBAE4DE
MVNMEYRRLRLYILTFFSDLVLMIAGFSLASHLIGDGAGELSEADLMLAMVPLFGLIAIYGRVYSIRGLESLPYAVQRLTIALAVSAFLLVFVLFVLRPTMGIVRGQYLLGLLMAWLGMIAVRGFVALYTDKVCDGLVQNRLIIDDGGPEVLLDKALHIDVAPEMIARALDDPALLDRLGRNMRGMDRVIVSCPTERREGWTRILRAAGVQGEILSETLNRLGVLDIIRENNVAFLVVSSGTLGLRSRIIKRAMDLLISVRPFLS